MLGIEMDPASSPAARDDYVTTLQEGGPATSDVLVETIAYRGWEIRLRHRPGLSGWVWEIQGPGGEWDQGAMCYQHNARKVAREEIDRWITDPKGPWVRSRSGRP